MSYQMPLSTDEQQSIENELDILFACQGKTLGKEARYIWISEIDKSGIPAKAIIQGLRFLKSEDLQAIKLNIILAASRKFMEVETLMGCENCRSGYVILKDEEGRYHSMRCSCPAGQSKARQGLTVWKGESSQFENGRILFKQ